MTFAARTIMITGAASGIGLATATLLAQEGARRLILIDSDAARLAEVDLPCNLTRINGDVGDPALWSSAELGTLDHAVINAGVADVAPIATTRFEDWRRVMAVNLDGAFLSLQAALLAMRNGGSIVCVTSAAGIKAEKGIGAYAASKAGLIQLSRVAAKEGVERGIRVNAIAPGGVETPIWDSEAFRARTAEVGRQAAFDEIAAVATPLKRFAKPEEIAGQIAFLLSDAAATMTGSVLVTDGGYLL